MEKTFFLVGQTAAGKTAAAVDLAVPCGGEIISADAFQIYTGLDLLTAKPSALELARVRHHLVGSVPMTETYNVARFRADALGCIAGIQELGKQAIVVGGSGMYVKALTHGLAPLPCADLFLRAELEALDAPALFARLQVLDPASAGTIDAKNKRRLVRAVEVCLATGRPFSHQRNEWSRDPGTALPIRGVFLFRDRDDLRARIDFRVESMFLAGVLDEVRALAGVKFGPTAERIIGLADIRLHLVGQLTLSACKERIKAATRQYAKRQMTWFKREAVFQPINLSATDGAAQLEQAFTTAGL